MPPQNPTLLRPPVDDASDAATVVQAWHRRLKANGPLHPAPTIAQAQSAGYGSLVAECTYCERTAHVTGTAPAALTVVVVAPDTSITDRDWARPSLRSGLEPPHCLTDRRRHRLNGANRGVWSDRHAVPGVAHCRGRKRLAGREPLKASVC